MQRVAITPAVFFHVPGPYVKLLQEAGFEVVYPVKPNPSTPETTFTALEGVSAVIAGGEYFTPELLDRLQDLRVIARAGVGYDRVNVPAATERGIAVTITPTANHECVAEHTFSLLLALSRNIVPHHHDVLAGDWSRKPLLPLRGRTLGLAGLGRIGRSVAIRAAAFRMRVIACDPLANPEFVAQYGIQLVDFQTLLAESDYLSLHMPLNDKTYGIMCAETFSRMKRGSFLVNTARGGLIVETDLHAALTAGHLAGAGLDVFEQEPTPTSNPLLKLPNVVASPHVGGGDTQSNEDMGVESARNIIMLSQGKWPPGAVVNAELQSSFRWTRN